jgi:hypothetical protein
MDLHLAHPVVGARLDSLAHRLGRRVVLVRSNGKAPHDLGLARLPRPNYRGSHFGYALDRAGVGRKTALAFWQRWYLRACGFDPGGYFVRVVGANSSRTLLVEHDQEDHQVIDTGPYGLVRHPIYTGLIGAILATGAAVATVTALLGALLIALGLWQKARMEEGFLTTELGADAYGRYCRRVPMLVPFLLHR